MKDIGKLFVAALAIVLIAIGICNIMVLCCTPPVEESVTDITVADSIIKSNDSIKLVVQSLDSVKNAKVIEVTTLDNDSTLKLFYELVSE